MADVIKERLLRFGFSSFLLMLILSMLAAFAYSSLFIIGSIIGAIGVVACLYLLGRVWSRLQRKPLIRQLPSSLIPAPSRDSVTLPEASELWRAIFVVGPIVLIPMLFFGYILGTNIYKAWFPVLIIALAILYVHEAGRGPHKRWWIANVLGEWAAQPWSTSTVAKVSYAFDAYNHHDPATERAHQFFGEILFRRYWLEVYFPNTDLVGYLHIDRSLYIERVADTSQELRVETRVSKLNRRRLQLRLA